MFYEDAYMDRPIDEPTRASDPQVCGTCGVTRDRYGFCPCFPQGSICLFCDAVVVDGFGIAAWEDGNEGTTLQAICDECQKEGA